MDEETKVSIGEAKGRPMLYWVGKHPLSYVKAFPAQKVEVFNPIDEDNPGQGMLFHGDNKDVMAWLLSNGYRGEVDLIYIDPPFDSGADYVRNVELRGMSTSKISGQAHSLIEQIQYTDIWTNDLYLQFIYERIILLRELLADHGVFCIHCDWHKVHHLQCVMDEIMGKENFVNQVVWHYENKPQFGFMRHYPRDFDILLIYAKNFGEHTINHQWVPVKEVQKQAVVDWDPDLKKRVAKRDEEGNIIYEERTEKYMGSVWTIPLVHPVAHERTGFPTQKPEDLLERVVKGFSNPDDLVLDCFVGSGTTAAVAQKLGRQWIAADINKGAIQTTSKRLQTIIQDQLGIDKTFDKNQEILSDDHEYEESPVSFSFVVLRVNDYDLQIQHNEAVNLAVDHIGIDRSKTDTFFDGTLGKRLAKIIPFNHPLSLIDLQIIKDEAELRKDERNIVVVCLGKETTIDPWLEEYNKNRPINKIEVIELRTDEKYGKFFVHQPAQASVDIKGENGRIIVEIEDFISPTIVERLEMDTPLFKAKIPDWRAMVDVVMIDTQYDGDVFDIDYSDVPEKKDDLVVGEYELPAPEETTTVAVKIIDMLGEEVLVTEEV